MTKHNLPTAQTGADQVDEKLARPGGLSYLEIPAINVRQSAAFYAAVFGWNVSDGNTDWPKFMDQSRHLLGRWVTGRAVSRDPGLLPYIYVDGIEETVARVVNHAGEIVKLPYREGNLWVSTIRDPAGNLIGLWQDPDR